MKITAGKTKEIIQNYMKAINDAHKLLRHMVFLYLGLGAGWCFADTVRVRPISIRVTDGATERSLGGIPVHYIVLKRTRRTSTFGIWPKIEPLVGTVIVGKLTAYTDSDGWARFSDVEVQLESYVLRPRVDEIDSEMLFVNLEPSEQARQILSEKDEGADRYLLLFRSQPGLDHLVSTNVGYKGYLLTLVNGIDRVHGREEESATVEFRPERFDQDVAASFTVELTRTR